MNKQHDELVDKVSEIIGAKLIYVGEFDDRAREIINLIESNYEARVLEAINSEVEFLAHPDGVSSGFIDYDQTIKAIKSIRGSEATE